MFNIKETFKKDDNSTINDLIIGYIKCVLIKSQICYMSILMVDSNQALNVIQKKGVEAVYNTILEHPSYYRVGLYIRLSEADSDKSYESESESIINQRNLLMSFVKQNEFTFVDEYIDDGFTGTNFDRPGFKRLLEDIEKR